VVLLCTPLCIVLYHALYCCKHDVGCHYTLLCLCLLRVLGKVLLKLSKLCTCSAAAAACTRQLQLIWLQLVTCPSLPLSCGTAAPTTVVQLAHVLCLPHTRCCNCIAPSSGTRLMSSATLHLWHDNCTALGVSKPATGHQGRAQYSL